jgi:glycosyltransferase involved in cell wall biosynthesis
MKILIVSNFFPPRVYGGYEIACAQVASELSKRHSVRVLTSRVEKHQSREAANFDGSRKNLEIDRSLVDSLITSAQATNTLTHKFHVFFREFNNRLATKRNINKFNPDLVYIWNLGYTSMSIAGVALRRKIPTGCFVFDYMLLDSNTDPFQRLGNATRNRFLKCLIVQFFEKCLSFLGMGTEKETKWRFLHFPSEHLRNKIESSKKIHFEQFTDIPWGVDLGIFFPRKEDLETVTLPNRILFVGQIARHKGLHLLLEAIGLLKEKGNGTLNLSVIGECLDNSYRKELDGLIVKYALSQQVTFLGFRSRETLPSVYRDHHILVFPSIWEEPLGIVPMEAMASGLAVISSGRGGSGELILNGNNGLLFDAGTARDLASKIALLQKDRALFDTLRRRARRKAEEDFCITNTLFLIENDLLRFA